MKKINGILLPKAVLYHREFPSLNRMKKKWQDKKRIIKTTMSPLFFLKQFCAEIANTAWDNQFGEKSRLLKKYLTLLMKVPVVL